MAWFNALASTEAPYRMLRNTGLLSELGDRELRIVYSFIHVRRYLAHEVVFDAGDEGQALYFLLEGEVLICRPGEHDRPVARLAAGSYFGEMALIGDSPRSADVVAARTCTLAALSRGDFERLMEAHAGIASKIALRLARDLGARLRGMLAVQGTDDGVGLV